MTSYSDHILEPSELKTAYLNRLYGRINRGLQDSYEQGYALLSNCWVVTPDGPTLLDRFSKHELELVKQWLEETGYKLEPYTTGIWFKDPPPNCEIWRVTW